MLSHPCAENAHGWGTETLCWDDRGGQPDAEEYQEDHEKIYAVCTWASYVLYTLGWGLTLIGRLFGAPGLIVGD